MAHGRLFILALLLATSMWQIQPSEGSVQLVLRLFYHCSSEEIVSPCRPCERSCGGRETQDCARNCGYGCICKTGWIRSNSTCIPMAQCEEMEL
ncbi:chymotrypsin-elastase inhibitor ixodidin [Drosophila teissieri]|uniref:chymotrypsin-elastase inhibitor ixodidin n=1 Tax=Drosophila teissieri TaxID=7243 RepID=UPI001CBA28E4|nr:chymotrypsin-elastase inhibitor ixodidin [Drosophila teissieri]